MKRKMIALAALLAAAAGGLYLTSGSHQQDPHYYAAACVVINDMHAAASEADFTDKLREVIINENSSYAFDKVSFDAASARGAFQRYKRLNAQDKTRAGQGMDACLDLMLPKTTR